MILTADLVASVAQVIEDAGPVPGSIQMTDEDHTVAIQDTPAAPETFGFLHTDPCSGILPAKSPRAEGQLFRGGTVPFAFA